MTIETRLFNCSYHFEALAAFAGDIADVLQALPDKEHLNGKKAVSAFNKTYIRKFNKKHISRLPEIV